MVGPRRKRVLLDGMIRGTKKMKLPPRIKVTTALARYRDGVVTDGEWLGTFETAFQHALGFVFADLDGVGISGVDRECAFG